MKRTWKPLDLGNGLRLYEVKMTFPRHSEWNRSMFVVAQSSRDAASLIEDVHKDTVWMDDEPRIEGYSLNVYQPIGEDDE